MQYILGIIFILSFLFSVPITFAEVHLLSGKKLIPSVRGSKTIHIIFDASTWKTRGRIYWDVEGSIRAKLAAEGFDVVRTKIEPHALIMLIDYNETKGQPYGVNQYGTVLTGTFKVIHRVAGPLFEIQIQETAEPTLSGTPPYIDALHNFQTNPYYHYLGEIIWGRIQRNDDAHFVFLEALKTIRPSQDKENKMDLELELSTLTQHTMFQSKALYESIAIRRTIDEFVLTQDEQIVPILKNLVHYPDVHVKVRAVEAFGDFQVRQVVPFLKNLMENSSEVRVRESSQKAIRKLKVLNK